ncbi:MAG TPA: hypothetical protein VNK23_06090 [Candidatus Dormibacteraeota bacterium]|nr:hypothetical protein [Candidatus Dormibacteraeota bacterium]
MAISAQAQGAHVSAGATPNLLTYSAGGGAGFGGEGAGPTNFNTLPHIPPARFQATAVSGNSNDFVPSTFVPYKIAVAEGRWILAETPRSLGEFARSYDASSRAKAKFELVQDHHGHPVIRRR